MGKIDKEYLEYVNRCEESNTEPVDFRKWIEDYEELKEVK